MTEDPNHAAWLEEARSHLGNADPVLARLIDDRPDFDPRAWLAQLPPMDLSRDTWTLAAGQHKKSAAHADHPGRVICSVTSPDCCGAGVWRLTAAASTCEFGRDMTSSLVSRRR